jgi:hypothetical protein
MVFSDRLTDEVLPSRTHLGAGYEESNVGRHIAITLGSLRHLPRWIPALLAAVD